VKNEAYRLGPISSVFWINDIKALSDYGYSLKNCIVRPTKIATFWPTKDNHFCVTPNDCCREPLVFKQAKTFLAPLFDFLPPQTPGLDTPLPCKWWNVSLSEWLGELQIAGRSWWFKFPSSISISKAAASWLLHHEWRCRRRWSTYLVENFSTCTYFLFVSCLN